jgi:DNA-binding LacI/PurR family transcriptional regulator
MAGPRIADKRRLLYELLLEDIRRGRCPPGTKLPSEWDLVKRFDVSRTTVRRALEQLESDGLIERHQGQGSLVSLDAERRLAAGQPPPRHVAIVLDKKKIMNLIFHGILNAFHEHIPAHVRTRVYFHERPDPAKYADADAVVIDGGLGVESITRIQQRHPRLIVLNRLARGVACACTDNRAGGEMMAEHAIACGHRRIGLVHYGDSGTEDEFIARLKGIRATCAKARVHLSEVEMRIDRQFEFNHHQALERLLRTDPEITVILCLTDSIALHALEVLAEANLAVPDRVALIGFDDLPNSRYLHPALTTIRQPVEDIGEAVAGAVLALIEGRPPRLGRLFRPQLVPRASCPRRRIEAS